tara:strand:- start:1887 stop:2033 length:147 start_codon:yes stop_codon:yes gene_type:complete
MLWIDDPDRQNYCCNFKFNQIEIESDGEDTWELKMKGSIRELQIRDSS